MRCRDRPSGAPWSRSLVVARLLFRLPGLLQLLQLPLQLANLPPPGAFRITEVYGKKVQDVLGFSAAAGDLGAVIGAATRRRRRRS